MLMQESHSRGQFKELKCPSAVDHLLRDIGVQVGVCGFESPMCLYINLYRYIFIYMYTESERERVCVLR